MQLHVTSLQLGAPNRTVTLLKLKDIHVIWLLGS